MAIMQVRTKKDGQLDGSRLGRLLVSRGIITHDQLQEALRYQTCTKSKLGQILVSRGLLTERKLAQTLKHQQRCRYAAAFATMVLAPLQPAVGFSASFATENAGVSDVVKAEGKGMQTLSELEMRQVQGQGWAELPALVKVRTAVPQVEPGSELVPGDALQSVIQRLIPLSSLFDVDMHIRGIHYRPGGQSVRVLADGRIEVMLPQRVDRIALESIRIRDSNGPAMGNLYISDLQFHKDSSIGISAHR